MRTLLVDDLGTEADIPVEGDEAHHARASLRLKPGDPIRLVDGRGGSAIGAVADIGRHRVRVTVDHREQAEPGRCQALTICCAAPKGSRFEDLVRGLTELGVGAIQVLRCERSVRDPTLERARRVAGEAIKQCGRPWLPQVGPVVDFTALAKVDGRIILLDRDGGAPCPGVPRPTTIVVGPEGGLSATERDQLLGWGAEPVRLAEPILRIETAALAAAAVWACAWEQHER